VLRAILCLVAFAYALSPAATRAASQVAAVQIGQSVIRLYTPWRFKTGDDLRWADPNFDDAQWKEMDLTPPAGATDGDVGLEGFAPGWNAKGYSGYHGFAWYRMRIDVTPPNGQTLALLGPWAVDSAYQVYVNGRLLGAVGKFAGSTPQAFGYHYARFFALPNESARGGSLTIALRVWGGPWVSSPTSGGVHIAPAIGNSDAILDLYHLEEFKIFEGYVVDAIPAALFVLTAAFALCLLPLKRDMAAYGWLAAALLLSAIQRGNQAFFFWFQLETIQEFVVIVMAIVGTLVIAAWIVAWRAWIRVSSPSWLPRAIVGLSLVLMAAQILSHRWLFSNPPPQIVAGICHAIVSWTRLAFFATLVWIVYRAMLQNWRETLIALPAVLAMACFVFSAEVAALHAPGIWFPWGVGVSLSEYASVATCAFVTLLLLRRLWALR
jgi:hypothetical protein